MGREQHGISEEKLRALEDYEGSTVFSEEERAVLRYAEGMTRTPVEVSDQVFDALRGFLDEAQIVELTSALAWEQYRARFDHALGVESGGFSEGAFCPAPAARRKDEQSPFSSDG